MSMHSQVCRVGEGPIQHDVVGFQELTARHGFEAQTKDMATVDGAGVWVLDFEGGDRACDAVDTLLEVGSLFRSVVEEVGAG